MSITNKLQSILRTCASNGSSYRFAEKAMKLCAEAENEQLKILLDAYINARTEDHWEYFFNKIKGLLND